MGSTYKGQKCGTFGDISVISFNGNKIITTSGGGALIVKDESLKKRAVFLATQAKDDALHYEHSSIGYNYRMSNISAGIGRGQMEVLEERIAQRRANHLFYHNIFKDHPYCSLHTEPSDDFYSNHWLNIITIDRDSKIEIKEVINGFSAANIEIRPIWKPMHLQPVFMKCHYFGKSIAEDLFNRGLCLPSGSNLTQGDKQRITEIIKKTLL